MTKYKLYEHTDGRSVITMNDIVVYKNYTSGRYSCPKIHGWTKAPHLTAEFIGGDIALDKGFKFISTLTKSDIFAHLL